LLSNARNTILNQNIRINWYLCNKTYTCQLIILTSKGIIQ
jgi:hypothetical protein